MTTVTRPSRFSQFRPKAATARLFGAGITATRPTYRMPFTAADDAWLVADNARREREARELDRLVDELAAESEAQDRYERGLDFC